MRGTINWTEQFSVGHPEVDEQHKKLIALANAVRGLANCQDRAVIEQVLKHILEYARYHFASEERILAKAGYPFLGEHKTQHQILIMRAEDLWEDRKHVTPQQIHHFLFDFVYSHIMHEDMQYKPHVSG